MNHLLSPNKIIAGAKYATPEEATLTTSNSIVKILITPAQLVYLVIERTSNKLVCLQPYQFSAIHNPAEWLLAVEEIFETDYWLKREVSEKKTSVFTTCLTLVPRELDNEKSRASLLKLNCPVNPEHMIYADHLHAQKINLLFALPPAIAQSCTFVGSEYPRHSLTGFIDHLLSVSPANGQDRLFVYFQSNTFQLVLIRNQTLCYCNSFNYRSPEDFMYYLLFACKQLHIDPELIAVTLMGEIVRDSVIYQLLIKYIRNIEFAKPFEAIQFDADYPMPHYFFYNLFCL